MDKVMSDRDRVLAFRCTTESSANLTAAAWNRNDEFLRTKILFELLYENCAPTDPRIDLTPTKGTPFGSEPTVSEFHSQDTDSQIGPTNAQDAPADHDMHSAQNTPGESPRVVTQDGDMDRNDTSFAPRTGSSRCYGCRCGRRS
ncbi:hypothetical protein JG688_00006531 [Phytophthora aleatoria]|uniref:Uncharacterized protein n=1 Tax=Phytophthora aleatoria TaxID=2496075 RepID=A0A8J5M7N7_9STRA|nr:hypothetical protein JG688_00006531 [Phytophthora aleatoria]